MKSLDLGCGANPKNPFNATELFGIDVREIGNNIKQANLFLESIPFDDDSFDYVTAHDFMEHVPRVLSIYDKNIEKNITIFPLIKLMNEIYRVLVMGGVFYSRTPSFPYPEAFQDPTHVNIITEKTYSLYFNDHYPVAHIYGFNGGFKVRSQNWDGCHLITELVKSNKPNIGQFLKY